eukprot:TRINITY_DN41276_c0_g1_i1.p1 TRINITY_DN41276_c0_g1~~TRINITY_DN41276_c0_g1_i1.p1  ORF type:complete len:499 (-),score=25.61 TRINITY_DN41276_c0_g1_i1:235-1662(-)
MSVFRTCSISLAVALSFAGDGRGVRFESDKRRLAVSRSQVAKLCAKDVVRDGCEVLHGSPVTNGQATSSQLARILFADASTVDALLQDLGFARASKTFSCRDLCEAAVSKIPTYLGTAAPSDAGLGCIDGFCTKQVGISRESLVCEGIEFPDAADEHSRQPLHNRSVAETRPEVSDPVRRQMLFRSALNIVFGVFPAIGALKPGGMDPSATTQATHVESVTASRKIPPERYDYYRKLVLRASAWIAITVRRLNPGQSYVKRFFRTRKLANMSEVDDFLEVVRNTLTSMLHLTSYLYIKESVDIYPTTTAFVETYGKCDVWDNRDCGRKNRQGRHIVNICEAFWSRDYGFAKRVGILVHELAHHRGAKDYAYCEFDDCDKLDANEAVDNADTYLFLVKSLVSRNLLNERCNTRCNGNYFQDWTFTTPLPEGTCGSCFEYKPLFCSQFTCVEPGITVANGVTKSLCCIPHACSVEQT